jgi:hypothetical protein
MSRRLPDFLVIGAMKCATSTLHEQLARQPGLFLSEPKEPNFFSDDDQYARGLDWYAGLFAAAAPGDLCGESSTHYTKRPALPNTLPRMRAVLDRPRLVYVMRHPVDRLVSHYVHEWTENRTRGPIDRAVAEIPDLVDFGRYAMQLEPYLDAYGPESVLPVFYEHMTRHPQQALERIARFIGYEAAPTWHHDLGPSNVGAQRLRKSRLRELLAGPGPLRELRRRVVPQAWTDRVKARWQMKSRPALGPDTLARVRDAFDADLERLGRWLATPLSCDTFRDAVTDATPEWSGAPAGGPRP